ncbi:hypothetical protein EJO83_28610, partial [Salmonella enterica]|nr:hypothetical protein [Salmonella enterica]ECC3917828.1 hypothetical protein [Salmonella enterica subsp. diarizonae]EHM9592216.1 hypothetical protein [Salmonella enterica subsp. enterica serovar Java]EBE1093058.1 hypothetical protein [Salmonella enterica]EKQ0964020.1 hypothetical protein [Salmonella enterica]
HEALRTTFIDVPLYGTGQEMSRALIAPQGLVPLDVADLRGQPDALRQADRLAYAHRTEPFDLAGGPLWRALLISEADDIHQLLLTQHHLITDAWSMVRLVKELIEFYHAPSLPAQVPQAVPDYSDYVYSQRNNLQARQHQQHLSWWQEKLRDLPRLVLPIASNTLSPGHHGDAVRINISQTLTEQVRRFSQQNGCTVFVTLLSAWVCTLYRYSGQGDFGIGTLSAGRENSDFDEVQGFFVNILVLRAGITGDMNFAGLVSAMNQELLESLRR